MPKLNFTDSKLRSLPLKRSRYSVMDNKEDGLELIVYPKGAKTFCLYKRVNGVPTHQKIGRLGDITTAQAREIANGLKNQMNTNPYLSNDDKIGRLLMRDVFAMYLNSKINLSERTISEYKRLWDDCINNHMGSMFVYQINVETIEGLRNKFTETPYQANRCISLVKALFNYLRKKKSYTGTNPANGVDTFKEESSIRALSYQEVESIIRSINKGLAQKDALSYYAILFLLLIPVRKQTILGMRWQDLKLKSQVWIVPSAKNRKNLLVNLPDAIMPVLDYLKRRAQEKGITSGYVFYSRKNHENHITKIEKAWSFVKQDAKLIGRIRIHDFRHTYATFMAQQTGNAYKIKVALGHKSLKSSEVYVNMVKEHIHDTTNEVVGKMVGVLEKTYLEKDGSIKTDISKMLIQGTRPKVELINPTSSSEAEQLIEEAQAKRKRR